MDKRISKLLKMMIDHNVKKVDIKNYFGWSWTYTTLLFNSKLAYLTDEQIKRIYDALPIITKTKKAS